MNALPLPPLRPLALFAGLCLASAGFAQTPGTPPAPASGDTIRLSDSERDAILDSNTVESAARARGEMDGSEGPARGIHGEVGVMVGSHGTRGAYGVADIPLGDNAGATVAFESSRFGGYRR